MSHTLKHIRDGLRNKKFSASEITEEYLKTIEHKDSEIGAFLHVRKDAARAEAKRADEMIAGGKVESLTGIPLALKDNMLMEAETVTAGSKILEHYRASYDGGVVKKLKEQGAVILGRTNLDEFAMGSSTENSAFHVTKNPHDATRVAGGSSGGSAAAVAGNMAAGALGSDTGGSIRQPAAFCGVVGLKPTYGAVSRSGLIAMASSLDQIGPFAHAVEDARIMLDAIRGHDPLDATSTDFHDTLEAKEDEVKNLVIGVPDEYFIEGLDPHIASAVEGTIEELKKLGFSFKRISLPHTRYALSAYYIIMPAEVSANLARFDGVRYTRPDENFDKLSDVYTKTRGKGFGAEVKRRIILGTFVLSSGYYDAYYGKAQEIRAMIRQDFDDAFREVDVILTPVTPTPAFTIGEKSQDPLAMYLSDIFTIPLNLAGLPGISIPCRGTKGTLPAAFQLIGKAWREKDILGLGEYYEKNMK